MGNRAHLLSQCIDSVRSNDLAHICIVSPIVKDLEQFQVLCDSWLVDPSRGLAAAINAGIKSLPESVKYVNWLGDDDLVTANGLMQLSLTLDAKENTDASLAYGHCRYIDLKGTTQFVVRPGRWAEILLRFGPQLISQPAILFRRDAFQKVGGLDERLGWAFDLDLLIKLRRSGRFASVPQVVASYRWHPDALSVGGRQNSVREASKVRVSHLAPMARPLSAFWEPLVRMLVRFSAQVVGRRVRRDYDIKSRIQHT